jgi:NTE family protein
MSFKPFSLANVAAFRDLPPEALRSLEDRLQPVPVRRGDCIVRQGEDADALHIVVLGRFAVEIDGDDEPVAEISHGSTIGEIAFFAGGPRTATVRAIRDGVVVRLSRDDFNSISKTTPAIWAAITSTLAERLATETRRRADLLRNGRFSAARPRPRTISVVGVCDEHIPPEFLRSFSEAARARPGTIVISSDTLDDVLGRRANDVLLKSAHCAEDRRGGAFRLPVVLQVST